MSGIFIPSKPEDIGALGIGQGGIPRGDVFPAEPLIGEYFYRTDLNALFIWVEVSVNYQPTPTWSCVETFSSSSYTIYAQSGATGDGLSPESPCGLIEQVSALVPNRSRNQWIDISIEGDFGSNSRLDISTEFIGAPGGINIYGPRTYDAASEVFTKAVVEPNLPKQMITGIVPAMVNNYSYLLLAYGSSIISGAQGDWTQSYVISDPYLDQRPSDMPLQFVVPTARVKFIEMNCRNCDYVQIDNLMTETGYFTGETIYYLTQCVAQTVLFERTGGYARMCAISALEFRDSRIEGISAHAGRWIKFWEATATYDIEAALFSNGTYPAIVANRSDIVLSNKLQVYGWESMPLLVGIKIGRWSSAEASSLPAFYNCDVPYDGDSTQLNGLIIVK